MEWMQALNDAIDYIEKHLTEKIQCEEVAKEVHLSSFHFQRAFTMLSGMTIQTYIRNRKLSLAGEELMSSGVRVTDVALKYGYESVESFSKAFQRYHGIAPSQMSKKRSIKVFQPVSLKIHMDGGIMEYHLEEEKSMKVCIQLRRFTAETCESEIPKFWMEYFRGEQCKKVPGYLGVSGQLKEGEEEFSFGIGADSSAVDSIPEGFIEITIPAYTWIIFKCVGKTPESVQRTWDRIYSEWMPTSKYEVINDYCLENYLPGDSNSDDYVCEIWLPIKNCE